jgi:hypothetical protein
MMYRLVFELAATDALLRVPVTVTCRVLGFSTNAFSMWRADPVCARDLDDAYLTNDAVDLHADDLKAAAHPVSENRVWWLCSAQRLWSAHSKKRGLSRKPVPRVHDDLLERDFTAIAADVVSLTDVTEHPPRGQAPSLCSQGRLLEPERRLLPRLTDEVIAGRRNTRQRDRPADAARHDRALRPRQSIPVPQVRPAPKNAGRRARWDASVPAPTTSPRSRSSRSCRRTSSGQRTWTTREELPPRHRDLDRPDHRRRRQRALERLTPIEYETIYKTAPAA